MKNAGLVCLTLIAALLMPMASRGAQDPTGTAGSADALQQQPSAEPPKTTNPYVLKPTVHPRLPANASQYWLAPTSDDRRVGKSAPMTELAEAVKLEVDANFAKALPILSQKTLQQGPLGDYDLYYRGLAELRLGRPAEAKRTFDLLAARPPVGYLVEAAALRQAECDEALGDESGALEIYERLSKTKTTAPDEVLMRLGRTARALGNGEKAIAAFFSVVYEFPFSDLVPLATAELDHLSVPPLAPGSQRYKLELGRAERLFGAKRYSAARPVYESLHPHTQGDDRQLVDLRLAECDYFLKHARAARDGVRPYTEKASRQGEALFFYAIATRDLGDTAEYTRTIRRVVKDFPEQSWAEEALNNLATYYVVQDEDDQADQTFREMYQKYPTGHYAERAAWKVGWWAYRSDRYRDTIAAFESGAANFPRSDYRPAWMYWSARSHEALKEQAIADARYQLVVTDYLNTYYGRLSAGRLADRGVHVPERRTRTETGATTVEDGAPPPASLPPNEPIVRALLALNLYDQALDELHFAQKTWGDTSVIQATFGWIYNQRGDLRAGINAMKRAYPQYLTAGGEEIPAALMRVRFPVNYWPQIQKYSTEHGLDPYMMAALIAQESNFIADIRSRANAYGLMQILPSAGRQYAKAVNRRFSVAMLKSADTNLRMGTAYFADLVKQFGSAYYALASYNAGPNRVARWISERPGVAREEFIDDMPFPETQDYVKKIITQAEDYRRLYGPGAARAEDDAVRPAVADEPPTGKSTAKKPHATKKTSKTSKA